MGGRLILDVKKMAILLPIILAFIAFYTFVVLGTDPRDAGKTPRKVIPIINTILLIAALGVRDESLLAPILFSLSLSCLLTPAIFSEFKTFSPLEKASDFALVVLVKMVALTILAVPLGFFESGWWVIALGAVGGVLFLSRFRVMGFVRWVRPSLYLCCRRIDLLYHATFA